ncbi:cell division protein ZipA [Glaciecola sp. 1036]|uniref:cell division protein ZipA n=1 Tax=Alteromonadaceae TaxID=72275 RepID=UPI003D04823D
MQRDLQIALIIIGGLVIVGILLHGFWTTRKQKAQSSERNFDSRKNWEPKFNVDEDEDLEYDEMIISPARVIQDPAKQSASKPEEPKIDLDQESNENIDLADELPDDLKSEVPEEEIAEKVETVETKTDDVKLKAVENTEQKPIYSGVVTQPKPEFVKAKRENIAVNEDEVPEPPAFLLKKSSEADAELQPQVEVTSPPDETIKTTKTEPPIKDKWDEVPDFSLDVQQTETKQPKTPAPKEDKQEKEFSFTEQARRLVRRNKKTVAEKIRKEPVLGADKNKEDQMRIDFGDQPSLSTEPEETAAKPSKPSETDVIILNVQTPADNPISGAALLPMLLTLGFKFGEHDIFHRHVNTNGKGPILFSLTNMFKPGIFDIDNMENFTTQGVSLFMMLPIDGDPQQVFNMMHNAARKISDEFKGKILDGNKVPISKQSLQQYSERIRDFERRRLTR